MDVESAEDSLLYLPECDININSFIIHSHFILVKFPGHCEHVIHTYGQFCVANPINAIFFGKSRKLVNLEQTHANTWRTCKSHLFA